MAHIYRPSRIYIATTLHERVQRRIEREAIVEFPWTDIVILADLAIESSRGMARADENDYQHCKAAIRWLRREGIFDPIPHRLHRKVKVFT